MSIPQAATTWSPSMRAPVSSTARQRSASPSKAMPMSYPPAFTMAARESMWVEPHFSLIFTPSGSALMTSVLSLEKRSNSRAAVAEAAPLAQSTKIRRPPRVESMVDSRWSM